MTDTEPVTLFAYLEHLAIAQGRKTITGPRGAVAILVALEGKGTTGEGCTVDAARIAAEVGLSDRQVWRIVADLVESGWLQQTVKSAPGTRSRKGRRARYRLTRPSVPMSDVTIDTTTLNGVTRSGTLHDLESVRRSDPETTERLTFSAQSSDTVTPDDVTLPTSGGTTEQQGVEYLGNQQVARDAANGAATARAALRRRSSTTTR